MNANRYHRAMRFRLDPSLAKTLSFAVVHFTVAFTLGWLLTGSVVIGGVLALVEPACNTVAFYVHEKLWARRGRDARGQRLASASAA
jgi:uncharacterized membrane protein